MMPTTTNLKTGHVCQLLTLEAIQVYWPQISELLDQHKELWIEDYDKEDLLSMALDERIQLWGAGDKEAIQLVIFTQLAGFPKSRYLELFLCLGRVGYLKHSREAVDAMLETFAHIQGCKAIRIMGREAWLRVTQPFGFRQHSVVLQRPVASTRSTQ